MRQEGKYYTAESRVCVDRMTASDWFLSVALVVVVGKDLSLPLSVCFLLPVPDPVGATRPEPVAAVVVVVIATLHPLAPFPLMSGDFPHLQIVQGGETGAGGRRDGGQRRHGFGPPVDDGGDLPGLDAVTLGHAEAAEVRVEVTRSHDVGECVCVGLFQVLFGRRFLTVGLGSSSKRVYSKARGFVVDYGPYLMLYLHTKHKSVTFQSVNRSIRRSTKGVTFQDVCSCF